jgi:hypothetical protein
MLLTRDRVERVVLLRPENELFEFTWTDKRTTNVLCVDLSDL